MSARQKKRKRPPKSVCPEEWWKSPTFYTYAPGPCGDGEKKLRVELVLPNGEKIDLRFFPIPEKHDDLRRAVAEHFKKIWDPKRHCRRTPST